MGPGVLVAGPAACLAVLFVARAQRLDLRAGSRGVGFFSISSQLCLPDLCSSSGGGRTMLQRAGISHVGCLSVFASSFLRVQTWQGQSLSLVSLALLDLAFLGLLD